MNPQPSLITQHDHIESTRHPDSRMRILPLRQWVIWAVALPVVLLLALPGSTTHAGGPSQELPYDEAEAQSIDRHLMCPVCPAETIDQAQVEISRQMRAIVREMLAAGASRQEILDFFVARYGVNVLAAPPKSGINLLAWALPVAGVLAAMVGVFLVLRSMVFCGGASAADQLLPDQLPADPELGPYLETVDRELALTAGAGARIIDMPLTIPHPSSEDEAIGASNQDGGGVEDPGEGNTA